MFRNINNPACTGANFYSYDAFVAGALALHCALCVLCMLQSTM
jgi:hypothetical protein